MPTMSVSSIKVDQWVHVGTVTAGFLKPRSSRTQKTLCKYTLKSRLVRRKRVRMIDGEAFLLLTQADIVKIMSVKLGPALKIYNAILMFKNADDTLK
ncbi:Lethal(3)malignant brain tumor-like 4 protein [Pteropus alecto]|uniref:Lethal(3)malignant brain tumor-like 4 protein n=1 Tax=Pteropus alecto TaxID=9402 RepID=L5JXZ4_PTEAL|nr:Lethal(3)malignant brain tumor-like 4 protein [Pteropus alecto]